MSWFWFEFDAKIDHENQMIILAFRRFLAPGVNGVDIIFRARQWVFRGFLTYRKLINMITKRDIPIPWPKHMDHVYFHSYYHFHSSSNVHENRPSFLRLSSFTYLWENNLFIEKNFREVDSSWQKSDVTQFLW